MNLSKIDLLNKRFSKSFRGYCRTEVDQLLQEAAEAIGDLSEDKKELHRRVADLEASLAEHKQREETLRDTLMTTQRMIDDLKANARREAQLIIDEAQAKAEAILNRAHLRLAQLHEDIAELKRQRTQFEVKLRSLLDAHLRMLEMENQDQEQLEALESKLKFFKKVK
jgi:cell division initiation protein